MRIFWKQGIDIACTHSVLTENWLADCPPVADGFSLKQVRMPSTTMNRLLSSRMTTLATGYYSITPSA